MSIPSSKFDSINLNSDGVGIGLFFGPLESDILEYLWSVYPRAVVSMSVRKYVRSKGRVNSINTINSTLTKLRNKKMVALEGDVIRGPEGNLHKATCSKIEFISHAFTIIHQAVMREFPAEWVIVIGGKS